MTEHVVISDLHIDIKDFDFSVYDVEENKKRNIIIAGDILTDTFNGLDKIYRVLVKLSAYFKHVFFVFGNHDFNGEKILNQQNNLKNKCNKFHNNIHVLCEDTVIIDNVAYYGSTFWPYMDLKLCKDREKYIGDYYAIKGQDTDNLTFFETNNLAKKSYSSLLNFVNSDLNVSSRVIITHIPPIYVPSRFIRNWLSEYFYNSLTDGSMHLIHNIDYWIHGHVHQNYYKIIDNMRIVCNSRGYPNEIYPPFNPYGLIIEV